MTLPRSCSTARTVPTASSARTVSVQLAARPFDTDGTRTDHRAVRMVPPFNLALVPGATSAGVTIGVATLTGLLGLASGAAAAAAVTTSHERAERFRERMIDAADAFVANLVQAEEALETVREKTEDLVNVRARRQEKVRTEGARGQTMTEEERAENETAKTGLKQSLDTADDLSKEMGALLPRLWVVFRKESVGMQATQLHFVHDSTSRVRPKRTQGQHSSRIHRIGVRTADVRAARRRAVGRTTSSQVSTSQVFQQLDPQAASVVRAPARQFSKQNRSHKRWRGVAAGRSLLRASRVSRRSCGIPTFAGLDFSGRGLDYAGVVGAAVLTIPL